MSRRTTPVVVVAILVGLATAPRSAAADSETLYLRGGGVPITALSDGSPTSSTVRNFDWLRNDDPGVTLRKGGSANAGSSSHYQDFLYDPDGASLSGGATLRVWSAVADFDADATGSLEVFLLDCSALATDCQLITSGSASDDGWSASGDWVERTISFAAANHTFQDNRRLKLRIVVGSAAFGDMWIAYDSVVTPSSLTLDLGSAPVTTTTTTSPSTTTTTTTPSTTTSTTDPSTTTTTGPGTTTSTSRPEPGASSTTSTTSTTAPTDTPSSTAPADDDGDSTATTTTTTTTLESTVTDSTTPPDPTTGSTTVGGGSETGTGGSAPADIDRGALVVTNPDGALGVVPTPVVRVRIGPLEQLAVTFGTAAATIRSTFVPALALGAFGALLVITLFEQARRDWIRRISALLHDVPQSFQRMWIALRSRRAEGV